MTPENTVIEQPFEARKRTRKRCKTCNNERNRKWAAKKRAEKSKVAEVEPKERKPYPREQDPVVEGDIERCRNGHPRTEENTVYESLGNGKYRRRCRLCRRDRLRKRRNGERPDAIILNGVTLVDKSILDLTTLPTHAKLLDKRFSDALDRVVTPCRSKTADFADYSDEKIPSPEYAAELCKGCPLLELCRARAHAVKPGWGVLGGEVWAYGNLFRSGTYNGEEDNGGN